MRSKIIFSVIPIFLSFIASAQKSIDSVDSITKLLCKKWKLEYIVKNAVKIYPTAQSGNEYYQFNRDNTIILTMDIDDKPEKNATWKYDSEKGIILIKRPRSSNKLSKVIRLTEQELVIEEDVEGSKVSGNRPLIYHLKLIAN